MLTDEPAVYDPQAWPDRKVALPSPISASQIASYSFAEGSMGPKVAAAVQFVRATRGRAAIGSLESAVEIVKGRCGTVVIPD